MATFVKPYFDNDGDNTAQAMKTTEGDIYFFHAVNANTADAYVQFFDAATGDVTVGTTTPDFVLFVPGGDGTNDGAIAQQFYNAPVHFENAVTYACTTTATGNTDPTTGLVISATYR